MTSSSTISGDIFTSQAEHFTSQGQKEGDNTSSQVISHSSLNLHASVQNHEPLRAAMLIIRRKALVRMTPPKGKDQDWYRVWYLRESVVSDQDGGLAFPARLHW